MGTTVDLTAADGHELGAYMADAVDAPAAVVIVQEIFGVNGHIRSMVDMYAQLGYLAIAPALFDRAERGIELEYNSEGAAAGIAVRDRIAWSCTTIDVGAAVDHVRRGRPVAVVGYCYGAGVAWLAANELQLDAAVGYYGGQIHQFVDRSPQCPMLLHFGEADHTIALEDIADIAATYPQVPIHIYDGAGHGFNCDVRDSYDRAASALAQTRTNAFLATHLR